MTKVAQTLQHTKDVSDVLTELRSYHINELRNTLDRGLYESPNNDDVLYMHQELVGLLLRPDPLQHITVNFLDFDHEDDNLLQYLEIIHQISIRHLTSEWVEGLASKDLQKIAAQYALFSKLIKAVHKLSYDNFCIRKQEEIASNQEKEMSISRKYNALQDEVIANNRVYSKCLDDYIKCMNEKELLRNEFNQLKEELRNIQNSRANAN